jgi:hypothetical protein
MVEVTARLTKDAILTKDSGLCKIDQGTGLEQVTVRLTKDTRH